MITIQKDKQITAKISVVSGGPVSTFEWKVDDVIQVNNTDTLVIQPNKLSVGNHTIKFRGQNYCGKWSSELIENINIIEVTNMAVQTDPVTINQPTQTVNITLRRTSNVTVVVKESDGTSVAGATVSVAGISGVTNTSGTVTLANVPYGSQTVTTTFT